MLNRNIVQITGNLSRLQLSLLLVIFIFQFKLAAQEMPSTCIQSPQRTDVCANLLYKRAAIDLDGLAIKEGDMVCICLSDFADLRLEATTEQGKIDQLVAASRAATSLQISETELLNLLRH